MREVDVVHHNMRPGVAERLGVDYETAKRLNPTVIYCHTTMWGNDGPRATWPGFDQLAQASCGLEHELGGEGNGPNWYRFGMCDQACAVQSALAVLMALYWRERTGEGQLVDTSIVNGGVFTQHRRVDRARRVVGAAPHRRQRRPGFGPLYRLYETSDGWIAIACLGESHWAALATVVPGLDDDPRFADADARRADANAFGESSGFLGRVDRAGVRSTLLDGAGVPVEVAGGRRGAPGSRSPTSSPPDSSPTTSTRTYGRFRQFGHLVNLSDTPGRIGGPPPLLGQHSREVLTELGYSGDEIQTLRERGVTLWPD